MKLEILSAIVNFVLVIWETYRIVVPDVRMFILLYSLF